MLSADDYASAILDSAQEGIWTIGLDGLIKTVNASAVRMFGYDNASEMIGRNSHELVHYKHADGSHYPIETCPIFHAFQAGVSCHLDNEVLWRKDGSSFSADYRSVPLIRAGEIIGALVTFSDNSALRAARELLLLNEAWLSATLNGIGDAVIATDAAEDPKVTFLNGIAEELTGWKIEDAKGKSVFEVFNIVNETTRELAHNPIRKVIETGKIQGLANHTVLISKNGLEYVIEDSAAPIHDPDKNIQGVVLVFRDVTDERRARNEEENHKRWLELAIKAIPTPIYMADPTTGEYTFGNDAMEKMMGGRFPVGEKRLGQERAMIAIDIETGRRLNFDEYPSSRAARGEEVRDFRFLWRTFNGDYFISVTATHIPPAFGNPGTILLAVQDITSLLASQKEAERANQTKSAFLANMSHEIRTPLSAILGYADLLKGKELRAEEHSQYIETISRNGKALTRIIDDILDLAKVESGKLELEKVDFSFYKLIDDVLDLFRERTQSKSIYLRAHIEKSVPDQLLGDPTRIRQVLINIVGNAVKFTEVGGVSLEVQAQEHTAKHFRFTIAVKDTGVGLSFEQQQRLFQPFMQADNSMTRKFGGTGLGLSLSKRLANALGGSIEIRDCDAGAGCTFVVSFEVEAGVLPKLAMPAPVVAAAREGAPRPLAGIPILIADDSPDNRFLVARFLTKQGAIVTQAENGQQAVQLALASTYKLVLMDIQMPVMDGYEATRALREAGFKIPIIALTAHAMAEERARSLAEGCDGHLTKPLDQAELLATVQRFIHAP